MRVRWTFQGRERGVFAALAGACALVALSALPLSAAGGGRAAPEVEFLARVLEGYGACGPQEFSLEEFVLAASAPAARDLAGRAPSPAAAAKELGRIAALVREAISGQTDPRGVVAALNRVLFDREGFEYDPAPGEPDNFLFDAVLARKKGNCLGLSVLYLAIAERLGLPLRGVHAPGHCFVRWDAGDGVRVNVETGARGAARDDAAYARLFGVGGGRPYLVSLGKKEMAGVYLKSLGAVYSRRGREADALRLYRAAERFYPGLPELYFNEGVSWQKLGRLPEAASAYRRALALDPALAPAYENLGAALAAMGRLAEAAEETRKAVALDPRRAGARANLAAALVALGMTEEGIREYERALALDPRNGRAAAGLARAYLACGRAEEAAAWCDLAERLGHPVETVPRRVPHTP